MRIMKFGGTSVGSPDRISDVVRLVTEASVDERVLVVVSAFGGVTNELIDAAQKASEGSIEWRVVLERISQRHADAVITLVGSAERDALQIVIGHETDDLGGLLRGQGGGTSGLSLW